LHVIFTLTYISERLSTVCWL